MRVLIWSASTLCVANFGVARSANVGEPLAASVIRRECECHSARDGRAAADRHQLVIGVDDDRASRRALRHGIDERGLETFAQYDLEPILRWDLRARAVQEKVQLVREVMPSALGDRIDRDGLQIALQRSAFRSAVQRLEAGRIAHERRHDRQSGAQRSCPRQRH